jgi:hypothetical protein
MGKIKISILFLIFMSLFVVSHASEWDGGTVRMMSLGNIGIALPDSSNIVDLYSEGFSSFLVYREKSDVVSLSGLYHQIDSKFFGETNRTTAVDLTDKNSNYIIHWFTPGDVVTVQPIYLNIFTPATNSFGNEVQNFGGAEIKYAHLFGSGFSAGAMVKYTTEYRTSDTGISLGGGTFYEYNDHKITTNDLEFLADIGLMMDNGLAVAVSAGRTVPSIYMSRLPDSVSNSYHGFDYFGFNEYGYSGSGVSSGYGNSIGYKFDTDGVNVNAGVQYIKTGVIDASFSGGADLGYSYSYNDTPNIDYWNIDQKGTAYNAALKCRVYPADGLTAGLSAEGSAIDYTWENVKQGTTYWSDITAGVSYQAGPVKIPVEGFAHFNDGYYLYDRYGGVRGGLEWQATSWLTLRAGCNWPGITEYIKDITPEYIHEYTGGFGLNFGAIKADCGISYSERSYDENDFGSITGHYNNKITAGLGLKMVI